MPMQGHMDMSHPKPKRPDVPRLPVILCRTANTLGIDAAHRALQQGGDTLQAVLTITGAQENNPDDFTTGVGALPNRDGVVQLDACCFHGPSGRSAAVAGVTGIANASLLAKAVMETGYPMLGGADAERFGVSKGLAHGSLTLDRTAKTWELWKHVEALPKPLAPGSYDPDWPARDKDGHFLPASQESFDTLVNSVSVLAEKVGLNPRWSWRAAYDVLFPSATPLVVCAVDAKQDMSCAVTTCGLPWRMAGAASDIAMLGTGCFLDPAVGMAGASGSADANIRVGGANLIVQSMRNGRSPQDAGMDALRRIAEIYRHDMAALRFVDMIYYVLRKDGDYAGVSLWQGDRTGHVQTFTVHDGQRRTEPCAYLLKGAPLISG